jgi:hypothetical protein
MEDLMRKILLATIGLVVCCAASAQSAETPRDKWIGRMQSALPTALCAKGTAIRTCFSLTDEECEQSMSSATRVCIGNMINQIPETLRPDQGRSFGGNIGSCAAETYANVNRARYAPSDACDAALREAAKAGT